MSVFTKDLVCQQAVELVTDYLEDVLSRRERRAFERHLEDCDGCTGVPRAGPRGDRDDRRRSAPTTSPRRRSTGSSACSWSTAGTPA